MNIHSQPSRAEEISEPPTLAGIGGKQAYPRIFKTRLDRPYLNRGLCAEVEQAVVCRRSETRYQICALKSGGGLVCLAITMRNASLTLHRAPETGVFVFPIATPLVLAGRI